MYINDIIGKRVENIYDRPDGTILIRLTGRIEILIQKGMIRDAESDDEVEKIEEKKKE